MDHTGGFDRVGYVDDGHVGQGANEGYVFYGLVAGAAGAGNAGHEADDADREARVGHGVDDLVQRAAGGEHAERVHPRHQALPGQGAGHADHVRLGHARVDEAVRELRLEQVDLALAGQVAGQADDLRALPGQLGQGPAVGLEHRAVRRVQHALAVYGATLVSSAIAASARSAGSLMKWPSVSAGRQDRPCRVEVRQTSTWGRVVPVLAARAVTIAATSWPSRSTAAQPNACHFAAIGSIVVMLSTGPSTWELFASRRTVSRFRP